MVLDIATFERALKIICVEYNKSFLGMWIETGFLNKNKGKITVIEVVQVII